MGKLTMSSGGINPESKNVVHGDKVGGSYIFIHRMLMEHSAAMYTETQKFL